MAEFFARVNVRDMRLDHRSFDRGYGVPYGYAVMSVGSGVEDYAVRFPRLLNGGNNLSFGIALEKFAFGPQGSGLFRDAFIDRLQSLAPVFVGLSLSQQVQIRSVDHENFLHERLTCCCSSR